MIPTLIVLPEAEEDIVSAYDWYEHQSQGLGDYFSLCIEAVLNQLQSYPTSGQVVYKKIRRTLLKRFPYGVYYMLEKRQIVVLAVFHASRDPRNWKKRT